MLFIICIFTAIIHFITTVFYSMRLVGAVTKQIGLALCFFNMFVLLARTSNMFQAPMLGSMVDNAILSGSVNVLWLEFRLIILSAFAGSVLGAFFIPTAVNVFTQAIHEFDKTKSTVRSIIKSLKLKHFQLPALKVQPFKNIPVGFIWANLFVVAIYTIGILSALMAGALIPAYRVTAVLFSGIINGLATVLLFILVDPIASNIADDVVRDKRSVEDVKSAIFYLTCSKLIGELIIAQLLFWPSVALIRWLVTCVFI